MKDAKGHGSNARGTLAKLDIPIGADYHTLSSSKVQGLVDEAKRTGYRKPDSANGSTGRYFHDRLQRQAGKELISGMQGKLSDDIAAGRMLASGSKSAAAPIHDSMSNGPGYYSRVSAKGGRVLGSYGPQASHEDAAREAFAKHPTAKTVSTSRGQYGMDIRFHDRSGTKF